MCVEDSTVGMEWRGSELYNLREEEYCFYYFLHCFVILISSYLKWKLFSLARQFYIKKTSHRPVHDETGVEIAMMSQRMVIGVLSNGIQHPPH